MLFHLINVTEQKQEEKERERAQTEKKRLETKLSPTNVF